MNQQQAPLPFPPPPIDAALFDELVCLHCGKRFLACVCFEDPTRNGAAR